MVKIWKVLAEIYDELPQVCVKFSGSGSGITSNVQRANNYRILGVSIFNSYILTHARWKKHPEYSKTSNIIGIYIYITETATIKT